MIATTTSSGHAALLADLPRRGVRGWINGGRLRWRALTRAVSVAALLAMKEHEDKLVVLLAAEDDPSGDGPRRWPSDVTPVGRSASPAGWRRWPVTSAPGAHSRGPSAGGRGGPRARPTGAIGCWSWRRAAAVRHIEECRQSPAGTV